MTRGNAIDASCHPLEQTTSTAMNHELLCSGDGKETVPDEGK